MGRRRTNLGGNLSGPYIYKADGGDGILGGARGDLRE